MWAENTLKRSKQEWGLYLAAVWTWLSWIKAPRASVCIIPQKTLFITHHTESNRPSSQTHRQKQVHYFHLNRLASRGSGLSDCECVWGFTVFRSVRISSVFCCETQMKSESIMLVNSLQCGISILLFSLSLRPLSLRLHLPLQSCRKRLKN